LWDWLGPFTPPVEQHHERWDGGGYPHRLEGEEICQGARIVAVTHSFETMTAGRTYQPPMTQVAARERLAELAGTQFDPAMVRAFMGISLGRLRWAMGPLAVLSESPILASLARLAPQMLAAVAQTGTAAAATVLGIAMSGGPHNMRAPASLISQSRSAVTASGRLPTGGPGVGSASAGAGAITGAVGGRGGVNGPGTGPSPATGPGGATAAN